MTKSNKKSSILSDLLKRRVPHILGIYCASCWAMVQFVDWLINHYLISPHLSEFCLVAMVSFIPSICLIAYYHGTPGRDQWKTIEKIGIPINMLASVLILFIVFYPKDLGAVMTTVTTEDEDGQIIQREVPKSEFRKKIAIFYFENESHDSTLNWIRYGIPFLCDADLEQDLYISNITQDYFSYKVDNAGYNKDDKLPLSLKRKISKSLNKNYFLEGKFKKSDGIWVVTTMFYSTANGKLIMENLFEGDNIFTIVDNIVIQLKIDLEIPLHYLETTTDLPVQSITTENEEALASYIKGYLKSKNDKQDAAFSLFNNAIENDNYFLQAHRSISELKMNYKGDETWKDHWDIILKAVDKLTDRTKFNYKMTYYSLNGDEKLFKKLALRQVKLYPDDIEAHENLTNVYYNENDTGRFDNVINEYKIMLKLDPEKYELYKSLGSMYNQKAAFDSSITYYNKYAQIFIDDSDILSSLAFVYTQLGRFEEAISTLEDAILLSNEELYLKSTLLFYKFNEKNISSMDVLQSLDNMLAKADSFDDSTRIYGSFISFYFSLGNVKNSTEYIKLLLNMIQPRYGKFQTVNWGLSENFLKIYIHSDFMDTVESHLEYFAENAVTPYDNIVPYRRCLYYLYTGNYNMLEATIDAAEDGYDDY